ncbi:type VI secretion system-associated protein TagO [Vibrio sp.]|nr:type VI secretion system-associated protein TagO [Vibrio sp.]
MEMTLKRVSLAIVSLSIVLSFSPLTQADDSVQQIQQAKKCSEVPDRLSRLACFDDVFKTPIHRQSLSERQVKPFSWQQAMDSYRDTAKGDKTHLNLQGVGEDYNAWLTVGALNGRKRYSKGPIPVLMMSCIDKISRIELAMPKEVKQAQLRISLVSGDTKFWRTDDTGLLLTAGRGIPAIDQMKKIMRERTITLRSSDPTINGLVFETDTLREDLKPLRKRCDW